MTDIIDIDEEAACHSLAALAGMPGALAQVIRQTREARNSVVWRVPVTPRTVYCAGSLHRLAVETGARIEFRLAGELDERALAFFRDYQHHRLTAVRASRMWRLAGEWLSAGREAHDAAVRLWWAGGRCVGAPATFDSVVIIGAYGGDHIGDAAILGGVALDVHRAYGATHAFVMSARPDHTRRLVEGISVPLQFEIEPYEAALVDRRLSEAGALVLGGGPLFDSPRMLARHFAAVETARRMGKPFLIKGVGLSTSFSNPVSKWAARRILTAATSISVRSSKSGRHPLMAGLHAEIGRDLAFDYLEGRTPDRLPPQDEAAAEALLAGTGDALVIGINLRPTENNWRKLPDLRAPMVNTSFLREMAEGLAHFGAASGRRCVFVFFPMNSIQLGMSDLAAAYELQRIVADAIDLRVWEGDPCIDGVLNLLRRLDAVVAMRFHAAVFALAQRVPVIGIDYYPGGKVCQLFSDLHRSSDAATVEGFKGAWLSGRLLEKVT
ncbi:MAG: polysaccharide pyruvyl transferase family protein [Beijerinckiaceae bacterium]|nr:polysaccharide pyruvyl transferase family protein [Beijerinckiaceae bacterium]